MAVEGIITLGIGSDPGGLYSFYTLGLTASPQAAVTPSVTSGEGMYSPTLSGEGMNSTTISGEGIV